MNAIEKNVNFKLEKSGAEFYFSAIVEEAFKSGMITAERVDQLQKECIQLLRTRCERMMGGASSSITVEGAQSIMRSNLYTMGLYLKSIVSIERAVDRLKNSSVIQLYEKGTKLIETKMQAAKLIYYRTRKNRIKTEHYTYNATLGKEGIAAFFKNYQFDFAAHENQGSIDYQLFNPVLNLNGLEFIMQYLSNLYLENKFCRFFENEQIHMLLYHYDRGYKDLLINIFEQVLTEALGCLLAGRLAKTLYLEKEDVQALQSRFKKMKKSAIFEEIDQAAIHLAEELNIKSRGLKHYLSISLPKIKVQIFNAVSLGTLNQVLMVTAPAAKQEMLTFSYSEKMGQSQYREFTEELKDCRYFSDKKILMEAYIKSLGDFEAVLLDCPFTEQERVSLFSMLNIGEITVLVKQYHLYSDILAYDLSQKETYFQQSLREYLSTLGEDIQEKIREASKHIILEES